MMRIKEVFEIKQKKVQMKGFTKSEVLWCSFHGNEAAMQQAIDKGDLKVVNGMYYWHRDIHEHITGGKDNFKFEPQAMTREDKGKMLELLDYAPWAQWGTTQINIPVAELKMLPSQTQMPCTKHKNAWMPARQCASQCRISSNESRKKAS